MYSTFLMKLFCVMQPFLQVVAISKLYIAIYIAIDMNSSTAEIQIFHYIAIHCVNRILTKTWQQMFECMVWYGIRALFQRDCRKHEKRFFLNTCILFLIFDIYFCVGTLLSTMWNLSIQTEKWGVFIFEVSIEMVQSYTHMKQNLTWHLKCMWNILCLLKSKERKPFIRLPTFQCWQRLDEWAQSYFLHFLSYI